MRRETAVAGILTEQDAGLTGGADGRFSQSKHLTRRVQ